MEKEQKVSHTLLIGAVAGAIADFISHPVDTLRARLQNQRSFDAKPYTGTVDAFTSVLRSEGWRALYKGVGIVMFSTIPAHALYFTGYEVIKKNLLPSRSAADKGPVVHFMAGVGAEVGGAMIWVPMDVVKQRLQVQRGEAKYKGSFHALTTIHAEEGIRGLYRGYGAALATYGPFVGFYFVAFEQCKKISATLLHTPLDQVPFPAQLCNGALAGGFAAAVTCPMDVIKTRMQVQSNTSIDRYRGIVDAARRILQEEGVRAFGKGMVARIIWIAPNTALTIALYEEFKKLLKKKDI